MEKKLRTVNGVQYIPFYNITNFEDRVQEAITEHRNTLIKRLLNDLEDYVHYKFNKKLDKQQTERIKDRLMSLKDYSISKEECKPVVDELLKYEIIVLPITPYYVAIEEEIQRAL